MNYKYLKNLTKNSADFYVYVRVYGRQSDNLLFLADKLVFNSYRGQKRSFGLSRYFVDYRGFVRVVCSGNCGTFHIWFKENQVCS